MAIIWTNDALFTDMIFTYLRHSASLIYKNQCQAMSMN